MEVIGDKEGALLSVLTIPFSNACAHRFEIHHDSHEEPMEVFFDWAVNEKKEYLLLTKDDVEENRKDDCLDDFLSFDSENYIAYPIMKDYLETFTKGEQSARS
jgi:hypothetical protein